MKTPSIPLHRSSNASLVKLIPNFGLAAKDFNGRLAEDCFKISVVTNKLSIQEADIRKLRTEFEGKSQQSGHDNSFEKTENVYPFYPASEQHIDQVDVDALSFTDTNQSFLKKFENKPIVEDYLFFLSKYPQKVKVHFDAYRSLFAAIFGDRLMVINLSKMTVEGTRIENEAVLQILIFQRNPLCSLP